MFSHLPTLDSHQVLVHTDGVAVGGEYLDTKVRATNPAPIDPNWIIDADNAQYGGLRISAVHVVYRVAQLPDGRTATYVASFALLGHQIPVRDALLELDIDAETLERRHQRGTVRIEPVEAQPWMWALAEAYAMMPLDRTPRLGDKVRCPFGGTMTGQIVGWGKGNVTGEVFYNVREEGMRRHERPVPYRGDQLEIVA